MAHLACLADLSSFHHSPQLLSKVPEGDLFADPGMDLTDTGLLVDLEIPADQLMQPVSFDSLQGGDASEIELPQQIRIDKIGGPFGLAL